MAEHIVGTGEIRILVIDHHLSDWFRWGQAFAPFGTCLGFATDIQTAEKMMHPGIQVVVIDACALEVGGNVVQPSTQATVTFLKKLFPETGQRFSGRAYVPYELFALPHRWDIKLVAPGQITTQPRRAFLDGGARELIGSILG